MKNVVLSLAVGLAMAANADAKIRGWLGKQIDDAPAPIKVVIAPAVAPANVVSDVADGKKPSLGQIAVAANPSLAQVVEADRQTGVSEMVRNVKQLPKNANQTLNNANQGIREVRQLFPGFKAAVESFQADANATRHNIGAFLGAISIPAQFMLWAVTLLIAAKIYRFVVPKKIGATASTKSRSRR